MPREDVRTTGWGKRPASAHPRASALWAAYVRLAPVATITLCAVWVYHLVELLIATQASPGSLGIDRQTAMDGAARWLSTGSPFLERQLAGPYRVLGWNIVDSGEFLYPPIVLPVFAAMSLLPNPAWWIIPGALVFVGIAQHPPATWAWPPIVFLLMLAWSIPVIVQGNPVIWLAPVVMWAWRLPFLGPLVLFKPTLAPFALIGIRHRSWWVSLVVLAVVAVPFGDLWSEWVRVTLDARQPLGPAYSVFQAPFLLAFALAGYAGLDGVRRRSAPSPRQ